MVLKYFIYILSFSAAGCIDHIKHVHAHVEFANNQGHKQVQKSRVGAKVQKIWGATYNKTEKGGCEICYISVNGPDNDLVVRKNEVGKYMYKKEQFIFQNRATDMAR